MRVSVKAPQGLSLPRLNVGGGASGPFLLVPGETELPDDYWVEARKLSAVGRWEKAGLLEVLGAPALPAPPSVPSPPHEVHTAEESPVDDDVEASPLAGVNAKEAIAMVAEVDDPDTLRFWGDAETRKTVLDAIQKRLARDPE